MAKFDRETKKVWKSSKFWGDQPLFLSGSSKSPTTKQQGLREQHSKPSETAMKTEM